MSKMFATIAANAHAAGMDAGNAHKPQAMNVSDGKNVWHVPDGVCGFAWVSFKGNTAFGRYMKKIGIARPDYPTGLCVRVLAFNQSMERNEAYARAYAKVLNDNGITAYAQSRMD